MIDDLSKTLDERANCPDPALVRLVKGVVVTAAKDALCGDHTAEVRTARRYFIKGLWRDDVKAIGIKPLDIEHYLMLIGLPVLRARAVR